MLNGEFERVPYGATWDVVRCNYGERGIYRTIVKAGLTGEEAIQLCRQHNKELQENYDNEQDRNN